MGNDFRNEAAAGARAPSAVTTQSLLPTANPSLPTPTPGQLNLELKLHRQGDKDSIRGFQTEQLFFSLLGPFF